MGPRRVEPKNSRFWSGGAAGVPHDGPRAQLCTFQGSGLQKHQQNSTKRPQERERRMKIVATKFWAVRRRAVRWRAVPEGCPAEGGRRAVRRRAVRRRVVSGGGWSGRGCQMRGVQLRGSSGHTPHNTQHTALPQHTKIKTTGLQQHTR